MNELKQKLTIEEKMDQSQQLVKEKRQEYLKRVLDYKPKLKLIIEKTKELQEQVRLQSYYLFLISNLYFIYNIFSIYLFIFVSFFRYKMKFLRNIKVGL